MFWVVLCSSKFGAAVQHQAEMLTQMIVRPCLMDGAHWLRAISSSVSPTVTVRQSWCMTNLAIVADCLSQQAEMVFLCLCLCLSELQAQVQLVVQQCC